MLMYILAVIVQVEWMRLLYMALIVSSSHLTDHSNRSAAAVSADVYGN